MSVLTPVLTVDGARQLLMYSRESADRLLALQGQEDQIRTWAAAHGYEITAYARDNEVQGVVPADDRDGLSDALNGLQGPVRGLVVSHLDRIARSVPIMLDVVDRIWEAGRDLFSLFHGGLIERSLAGRELCRKAAEFAAYELSLLQWRLQTARRAKAAKGGYVGGRHAYGYVPSGSRLDLGYRPVPDEQETIRQIRADHASGIGYQRIARRLNAAGIPSATGRAWSPKVVRDIVIRPLRLVEPPSTDVAAAVVPLGDGAVVPLRRGGGA